MQIGVRSNADGSHVPLWAVMIGDTAEAERIAQLYHAFGPYALNATLWTHNSSTPGWVRTMYRRPRNADEALALHEDARDFTSSQEGDDSLLPESFAGLGSDLLEKVDFIIRYDDGSTKAYLYPGTSADEAGKVITGLTTEGAGCRIADAHPDLPIPILARL